MSRKKLLKFLVILIGISDAHSTKYLRKDHRPNFALLLDFVCATAKDELEKHPEMRTIAMVELENNFPSEFSREVLKCLPQDVNKVILNPHLNEDNNTLILPKESMVIYVADIVHLDDLSLFPFYHFQANFPTFHHLSKHLIISSGRSKIKETEAIFDELLNVVQIYAKRLKVIARSFDRTKDLTTFETFEDSQQENLSQILFPDKSKDLSGFPLYAVWKSDKTSYICRDCLRPNSEWNFFLDIIAERMNATFEYKEIPPNITSGDADHQNKRKIIKKLNNDLELDFFLSDLDDKFNLNSYFYKDYCFEAPLPEEYSITELILFLPLDQSCWMWLGITIAVSTLIWRISEGHWNFPFGAFAHLVGQSQLVNRIQTSRLILKILLQLLITTFFIFSNGYQSLVTSFMLDPVKVPLLKTIEEVLDSDLKIPYHWDFHGVYDEHPKYQKAINEGRVMDVDWPFSNEDQRKLAKKEHLARFVDCSYVKTKIERQGGVKSIKRAYLIEEVAESNPSDLYTRPFHPHIDKFQNFMDRSFEAGLHQAWETFYYLKYFERFPIKPRIQEQDTLDFGLIAPFFITLAVGFGAALLALWIEIFSRDFVSELSREYFKRKFDEIFRREIKVEKPKVKIIQVRPRKDQISHL